MLIINTKPLPPVEAVMERTQKAIVLESAKMISPPRYVVKGSYIRGFFDVWDTSDDNTIEAVVSCVSFDEATLAADALNAPASAIADSVEAHEDGAQLVCHCSAIPAPHAKGLGRCHQETDCLLCMNDRFIETNDGAKPCDCITAQLVSEEDVF